MDSSGDRVWGVVLCAEWQVEISPVHNFPLMNPEGQLVGWERRVYEDTVVIPQEKHPH